MDAAENTFVGLDLGTTNVKAVVADSTGRVLAEGSSPVPLLYLDAGGVEQDLEGIWSATLAALGEVARGVEGSRIRAIGVSSQGGAMQVLGARGEPRGRVISWLDARGRSDDVALTAELGREWFARHIGHGASGLAIGQVLRLRREHPSHLDWPNHVGFVGDIMVGRLGGRAVHDGTSCGLTLLYNPSLRYYDPDVLARLALSATQLPALGKPSSIAGHLLPEVARATGLPEGIPVAPAVHDQYAAALGSGCVRAGDVMFGAGTAWVLLAVTPGLADPVIDEAFVCHHLVDGLFGQILSLRNGGSALRWAQKLMNLERLTDAELDARLAAVKPGSDGLLFRPLLAGGGAAGVAADVHGRLDGLQLSHEPAHVLRAVVEGLACELGRHLQFLRNAGLPIARLVMCGGGAATGRATPRIVADLTGAPVACPQSVGGSLLGAAILARSLWEPTESLGRLATEMTPPVQVVDPGPDAAFCRDLMADYCQSLPLTSGRSSA